MMSLSARIDAYTAQTGRSTLTPRQARRSVRKALRMRNRSLDAFIADVLRAEYVVIPESRPDVQAALESVDTSDTWNACPTCNASGDERCVTGSGKPTKRHAKRPQLESV